MTATETLTYLGQLEESLWKAMDAIVEEQFGMSPEEVSRLDAKASGVKVALAIVGAEIQRLGGTPQ